MRLKTIGGLWIEGDPPPPPLGPRRMGLLALVAAAGRKGVSRDRAVGILWPETDQEQARHTLSQTLYTLKRETGRDWIVATTELRLDPAVSSDIGELLDALAAGDLKAVAELYTGPFLEGFYVPGASEFERWVEGERARLHSAALRAIEQLARQADSAGQPRDAIRWWHRLTELDPLNARYAAGHMRALASAGDRPSAIAAARIHREAVRRELDADPDPEIRQLEAALRQPTSPLPVPPQVEQPEDRRASVQEPLRASPGQLDQPKPARRPRWLIPLVLGMAIVLALAIWAVKRGTERRLPFLAVGTIRSTASADTTTLGPVLRDMLSTSLGGIEGLQVVANSRLVELMPRAGDTVPGATSDAARRAGATEVIEGELESAAGSLVLTLRRVDLGRGVVRRGYLVRAANRYALVDSATAAIARDLRLAPPSVTVSEVRTASPGAYALYDEGLRAAYGYDAPAAYRLMNAALERDSTFVMAAYYAWQLSRSLADEATSARAFERAKRLAPQTIERERLLIQASVATLDGPISSAAAIAETLTVRYPTDPDGHILLGGVRFVQGEWAGSVAAYERAFALDSVAGATSGPYCRVCLALGLMSHTYLWWDSAGAAERAARRLVAVRPNDPPAWNNLVEPLLRQGRRAEAEQAFERGARLSVARNWSGPGMHRDMIRWGRLEELDRELLPDLLNHSSEVHGDALWLMLLSLRDQGRLREARALAWEGKIPASPLHVYDFGGKLLDPAMLALEMGQPAGTVKALRDGAVAVKASPLPPGRKARELTWQLALAGTAHAAAGDTVVVRRLADSLEIIGRGSSFGRDPLLHHFLRGLLLQGEGRHAEAVDAFRRSLFSLTDGYTRTNLMMARSLLALGRGPEAIAVLRPAIHGGVDGSNSYVSRTELHEAMAMAFELAGRRDSALAHWRSVEQGWRHADPQFRERYLHARAAISTH